MNQIKLFVIKKGGDKYLTADRKWTTFPNDMRLFYSKTVARKELYYITQNMDLNKHVTIATLNIEVVEPKYNLFSQSTNKYLVEKDENNNLLFGEIENSITFNSYKSAYRYNCQYCGRRLKVCEMEGEQCLTQLKN